MSTVPGRWKRISVEINWYPTAMEMTSKDSKTETLIEKLRKLGEGPEEDHMRADELLLDYIEDADVRATFEAIPKWYG